MYKRKTTDEYEIQGHYGVHGWESVDCHENRADAKAALKVYRENEPQYPHRIVKKRVKIQQEVNQ